MRRVSLGSDRWISTGAFVFALFFLLISLYISSRRLFWYDEVFTTLTVRLPEWGSMWRALVEDNWDPMPIGYFAVVRPFDQWFGGREIGIRLPSALAVVAGMLLVYDSARRMSDRLHGFLAMALLTCSLLPYYAYEGRSYGLYFLMASLSLWSWITGRPAWAFGAIFFVGVLMHYYLVLCLAPFVIEELYQWRLGRRPGARIFAGIAGAMSALMVLAPQILASRKNYGGTFWARPALWKLPLVINDLVPAGMLLLGVGIVWILLVDQRKAVMPEPMTPGERVSWFFALIPLLGFLTAKTVTNAYHSRYLIGALPGIAVAVSALVWRRYQAHRLVSAGLLIMVAGYGGFLELNAASRVETIAAFGPAQERTREMLRMEDGLWRDGRKYIVLPDYHLLYLEARYYSSHPERYVLLTERGLKPAHYYRATIWTIDDLKKHYHEAALVEPAYGILEQLRSWGARMVLRNQGLVPIFYVE
jgi:hypothetical protein